MTEKRYESVYSNPHYGIIDKKTEDKEGLYLRYKFYPILSKRVSDELTDLLNDYETQLNKLDVLLNEYQVTFEQLEEMLEEKRYLDNE